MASLNKCMFIGNVTRDIDIRYMPNGKAVANFSIACNESYKDKQGNKQEKVEFVSIVMYDKLAEIAGEYLKKGRPVYVEGRLQTRKWEKNGATHYSTEIIADSMQMLGGGDGSGSQSNSTRQQAPARDPQPRPSMEDFEDDIPF